MRHNPRRPAGRVLGLATAVTAAALALSSGAPALATLAASAGAARTARAAATAASPAAGPTRRLLLISGDQLVVRSGGGRTAVAVRPGARHDAVTGLRFGGQVMEVPTVAMPFLGRGLDPRLFEVSALEKAESGGVLPVRVSFSGQRPAIPGLTVTRSSAGAASGYLTAASARQFGAALRRQFIADHARGRYGSDGLFGHHVSISLAGSGPLPGGSTSPAFKMHTLTVDGRNLAGKPDTGDEVFLTSADNVARFDGLQETTNFFYHGSAKFSVPAGHYWAIATFVNFTRTGGSLRMVVLPQFTVKGSHSTVHIAEKSASSEVTMPTPRPSADFQTTFEIYRNAAHGGPFIYAQGWSEGLNAWVSPTTRKPTVGTLNAYTSATLTSPAKASPGYAYNLDYAGPAGIVPRQHFTVSPASLGTVTERYYQDVRSGGGWVAFGGTVQQLAFEFLEIDPITMPQEQTQYFSAGHGVIWSSQIWTNLNQFSGSYTDDYRGYADGQHVTQQWNRYPLHPAPDTTRGGAAAVFPTLTSASRSGNELDLAMTPFSDNQFGHLGAGFFGNGNATVTGTYQVDQNGTEIAHGGAVNGIPGITLSSRPSVLRFVLNASRASSFFRLSPSSQTIWTWRSARDAAARVPAAWYCSYEFVKDQVKYLRQCAVQPLMTLSYNVHGLSLSGLAKPGAQVIDVTAGHIQLARTPAITGATAQVSYNDGDSWQAAGVTAEGGGHFRVAYSAPAGVDVTLRVTATDAAGGSISETIVRAYGVSL